MERRSAESYGSNLLFWIACGAGFLAVWLASHGYVGIVHDSRLYALQSLRLLSPGLFDADLFFAFGSQDQFTVFSNIYAQFIAILGLDSATRALLFLGYLAWILSLLAFVRPLAETFPAVLFAVLASGACRLYADYTFSYAEPYLTPRIFVEALILLGLAQALRGRIVLAGMLVAAGLPLHPLVTVTGFVYLGLYLVLTDRKWLLLGGIGSVTVAVLSLAGFGPFANLLARMDREWFEISHDVCNYAFVTRWELNHLRQFLYDTLLLVVALRLTRGPVRTLVLATILSGWLGVLLNLVLADFLGSVLVIQLQLSRTLWFMHLLSYLGLSLLTNQWLTQDRPWKEGFQLLWLIACGLSLDLESGMLAVSITSLIVLVPALADGLRSYRWAVAALTIAPISAAAFWGLRLIINSSAHVDVQLAMDPQASALVLRSQFLLPTVVLALIVLVLMILRTGRGSLAALVVSCAAVAVSTALWDLRSEDALQREEVLFQSPHPLLETIPEGSVVYWGDDRVTDIWFGLRRPSYVSWLQGAGLIFFRGTAIEWRERAQRILSEADEPDYQQVLENRDLPQVSDYTVEVLHRICQDPDLDFVVSPAPIPDSVPFRYLDEEYFLNACPH